MPIFKQSVKQTLARRSITTPFVKVLITHWIESGLISYLQVTWHRCNLKCVLPSKFLCSLTTIGAVSPQYRLYQRTQIKHTQTIHRLLSHWYELHIGHQSKMIHSTKSASVPTNMCTEHILTVSVESYVEESKQGSDEPTGISVPFATAVFTDWHIASQTKLSGCWTKKKAFAAIQVDVWSGESLQSRGSSPLKQTSGFLSESVGVTRVKRLVFWQFFRCTMQFYGHCHTVSWLYDIWSCLICALNPPESGFLPLKTS